MFGWKTKEQKAAEAARILQEMLGKDEWRLPNATLEDAAWHWVVHENIEQLARLLRKLNNHPNANRPVSAGIGKGMAMFAKTGRYPAYAQTAALLHENTPALLNVLKPEHVETAMAWLMTHDHTEDAKTLREAVRDIAALYEAATRSTKALAQLAVEEKPERLAAILQPQHVEATTAWLVAHNQTGAAKALLEAVRDTATLHEAATRGTEKGLAQLAAEGKPDQLVASQDKLGLDPVQSTQLLSQAVDAALQKDNLTAVVRFAAQAVKRPALLAALPPAQACTIIHRLAETNQLNELETILKACTTSGAYQAAVNAAIDSHGRQRLGDVLVKEGKIEQQIEVTRLTYLHGLGLGYSMNKQQFMEHFARLMQDQKFRAATILVWSFRCEDEVIHLATSHIQAIACGLQRQLLAMDGTPTWRRTPHENKTLADLHDAMNLLTESAKDVDARLPNQWMQKIEKGREKASCIPTPALVGTVPTVQQAAVTIQHPTAAPRRGPAPGC